MDLNLNSEDLAFRDEVRAFLKDKLDPKVAEKVARSEAIAKTRSWPGKKPFMNRVGSCQLAGEHGGTSWSVMQRYIFDEECAAAGAPQTISFGFSMIGPVLIAFGGGQKARYLPRIRSSELVVPRLLRAGLGVRPASLRTRAERDGDDWVINGKKPGPRWPSTPT